MDSFINLESTVVPRIMGHLASFTVQAETLLKGTLAWDFFVPVFCTDQTYIGQIISLMSVFDFVLEFADLFEFFNIWRLAVTQLTPSLTPRQLSQRQVRLHINWVNAEWDSTLTQLTGSLTPRWLSVRKRNYTKTGLHSQLWCLKRDSI